MKAKELMLGDWIKDSIGNITIVTSNDIECLEFNEIHSIERWHFEPILITPEILEKNGFVESDYIGTYYYTDKDGNYIQYDFDEKKLLVEAAESTFDGVILYVHKMQHALALCEVEKEIELL